MDKLMHMRRTGVCGAAIMMIMEIQGCHVSKILNVPPPTGIIASTALNSDSAAEGAFYTARTALFGDIVGDLDGYSGGLIELGALLTDEFSYAGAGYYGYNANIDFRQTQWVHSGDQTESGDYVLTTALAARSEMLLALPPLTTYETGTGLTRIGEAWALTGYSELFLAETYCAGVPLSQPIPGGGVAFGNPLSTDSLLKVAESHFDSALAHTNNNDTITALASVGLGRALLDRDSVRQAAQVVSSVPTGFVYDVIGETDGEEVYTPTLYELALNSSYSGCGYENVANREGTNGLDFVSAADPRLQLDSTLVETCDGLYAGLPDSVYYYPVKFGNPSVTVPLATGIEARLIQAEADLPHNGGSASAWLNDLNLLRNSSPACATNASCSIGSASVPNQLSGLISLTDPGTDTGEVSLMFHERAFWLFGTGTRLGDLRRLIRQYGRPNESVFPTGNYAEGNTPAIVQAAEAYGKTLPQTYGADVNVTLPTAKSGTTTANPNYKGCLAGTTVA